MLTAIKAKSRSQKYIKKRLAQELRRIENRIKDATSYGCSSITEQGIIDPEIKIKLEKLGYVIDVTEREYESYCSYCVKW